ncbi:MAG: hypothetical protein ACOVNU_01605 [Candidatus Kapaibacteriota bacterium]|jgi:hypothetical protein
MASDQNKNDAQDKTTEKLMEKEQDFLMKEMIKKDMMKKIETKLKENDSEVMDALKALIKDDSLKKDIW